jgi:hypothetical protein
MIISSNDRGVLEVFWRHRINRPYPEHAVADFFSGFTHPTDMLALRQWLAKQRHWAPVPNVSDAVVVKSVATAVARGELIVVDNKFGQNWPGTGIVIRVRSGSVLLLSRRKLRLGRDLSYTMAWLREAKDSDDAKRLREMLSLYRLAAADDQGVNFAPLVEKLLTSGQLVPVYHGFPDHADAASEGAPAPHTSVAKVSQEREEVVDPNTFGSDHLIAAQVAAMIAAAEAGVPFCEECNKARANKAES